MDQFKVGDKVTVTAGKWLGRTGTITIAWSAPALTNRDSEYRVVFDDGVRESFYEYDLE